MKRVYTSYSVPMAWHVRNVLQQHEIVTTLKNDKLFAVSGERPFTECMPEVWVINDLDAARAKRIISELETDEEVLGEDWTCAGCGEVNTASFEFCWNCQAEFEADVRETESENIRKNESENARENVSKNVTESERENVRKNKE